MNELRRKINALEASMNKDNQKIKRDSHVLYEFTKTPAFICLEIFGGVAAGYLLARNKTNTELLLMFASLSETAYRAEVGAKMLKATIKK